MFRRVKEYFSADSRRARWIRRRKANRKYTETQAARAELALFRLIEPKLSDLSAKLFPPVHDDARNEGVRAFCVGLNEIFGAVSASEEAWWFFPRQLVVPELSLSTRARTECVSVTLGLCELYLSLLSLFCATSYQVVVTYRGTGTAEMDSNIKPFLGTFEIWKEDARTAQMQFARTERILGDRLCDIVQPFKQRVNFRAQEIIDTPSPRSVAKFTYTIDVQPYVQQASLSPANALAKRDDLPIGGYAHQTALSAGILLTQQLEWVPYEFFSMAFNALTLGRFLEFLGEIELHGELERVTAHALETLRTCMRTTDDELNRGMALPLDQWPVPLIDAVAKNDVELVRQSLELGDPPDPPGSSPLVRAAEKGFVEVVKTLLEAGADVDRYDDGRNALIGAAYRGHVEVVEELLRARPDVAAKGTDTWSNYDAITAARKRKHSAIVSLLEAAPE